MTPIAEIARAAWMASEGDPWEDTIKAVRAAVIDEAIEVLKAEKASFASPEYATGQPLSSFSERFACEQCIKALTALKDKADESN